MMALMDMICVLCCIHRVQCRVFNTGITADYRLSEIWRRKNAIPAVMQSAQTNMDNRYSYCP